MKRLAVYVDGTWNVPHNNTNVWRMYLLTATEGTHVEQLTHYHVGVGTGRRPTVGGEVRQSVSTRIYGAFGAGVNASVRSCYEWLVRTYGQDDEIFIFGFSRGAFIARSLAGFIERCGLLYPGAPMSVAEVFERYRLQDIRGSVVTDPYADELEWPVYSDERLKRFSRPVDINFLGVWDTVRYHDLPIGSWRGVARSQNLFHVVQPIHAVRRIFHALAVDENRSAYRPELIHLPPSMARPPVLEQRWFPGAHSNVGGGYKDDTLALLSLAWVQTQASIAGLEFKRGVELQDDFKGAQVDSFATFLGGAYRIARLGRRSWRPIGSTTESAKEGEPVGNTNEVLDHSIFDRCRWDPTYRPKNLADWADRKGVDLTTCVGDRDAVSARALS